MSITDIKPYPKNPRDNDAGVESVANSINEFGWQQPIVVDKDNVIIVGHTRYKAAKKAGYEASSSGGRWRAQPGAGESISAGW